MSPPTLTPSQARSVYDRIGRKQDTQGFYEDPAVHDLLANARLAETTVLLELGCGTGRWALRLLEQHLPGDARYLGIDLSPVMLGLASRRLAGVGPRAAVVRADLTRGLPLVAASVDRIVVTYVLDLLSREAIASVLSEAHRVLLPGGLLCSVGLTRGRTVPSRVITTLWSALFRLSPRLVGGCRPLELRPSLPADAWRVLHHRVVTAWGVPSEVVVAEAIGP